MLEESLTLFNMVLSFIGLMVNSILVYVKRTKQKKEHIYHAPSSYLSQPPNSGEESFK